MSPNQDALSYSSRASFRAAQTGEKPSNILFGRTPFCADVYRLHSKSSSSSKAPWGKQPNSWTPWLFFLDQGFPVEYGLDTFNTPHTGTTLRHPQNWPCRLRCLIPLWHPATTSPLGNIFWRHSRFSTHNQNHKITVTPTSISSNSKHDFCYIRRTLSLARPTTCAAFSTLS